MKNLQPTVTTSAVKLPNDTTIQATKQGHLPMHQSINKAVTITKILPGITNASLLSIGQLCDNNCLAIFHKKWLKIFKGNKLVLQGVRNLYDGLWDVTFGQKLKPKRKVKDESLNVIIHKKKTNFQLAKFYHGALCSPVLATLQQAIKNNFN